MEQSIVFDSISNTDESKSIADVVETINNAVETINNVVETSNNVVETINNEIVNMIEYNLTDIVKNILANDEQKKQYSIIFNEELLCIINKIISLTPNTFNDIETSVKEVIKDGQINTNDIPQLITIVQKIYQVIYEIKNNKFDSAKRVLVTSNILKFIIYILVQERKLTIQKDAEEEFFKKTNLLIDSCVSLLSFPKIIKPKSFFKSFFGK